MDIILASNSKRRYDLLKLMGVSFTAIPSGADESVQSGISPDEMVCELSYRKAKHVFDKLSNNNDVCVIGSDTVVVHDGKIIGKPDSKQNAFNILKELSGNTHTVYTGLALITANRTLIDFDSTDVTFAHLSDKDITDYIDSGDPMDKAGAYGIQGPFCVNIEKINGSYFTVIGLPVHKLHRMLVAIESTDR